MQRFRQIKTHLGDAGHEVWKRDPLSVDRNLGGLEVTQERVADYALERLESRTLEAPVESRISLATRIVQAASSAPRVERGLTALKTAFADLDATEGARAAVVALGAYKKLLPDQDLSPATLRSLGEFSDRNLLAYGRFGSLARALGLETSPGSVPAAATALKKELKSPRRRAPDNGNAPGNF